MLKTHLKSDGEIDLIIISVGSNDITKLDTKDKDTLATNDAAINHSTLLVTLAREAADKHGIDVFVMERPARYDKKDVMKQRLNQVANGMLMPLTNVLDNVHLVRLPSLDNLDGRAKKEIFRDDGIHLTDVGLTVLEKDVIAGIKSVYTDVKPKVQDSFRNPSPHNSNKYGGRGRRGDYDGPPGGGYSRRDWDGHARGRDQQQSHGGRQLQQGGPGHFRNNDRNRNRQEPGMQDMVRDFMTFMNNEAHYRGRGIY